MPYYERVIHSGTMREAVRYMGGKRGRQLPRSPKAQPSTEQRKRWNEEEACRRLGRLMRCNFSRAAGDLFVVLTHADDPDEEVARRRMAAFLRRVKRWREKEGLKELRYIRVDERQGQWHHHLMLSAMPIDQLAAMWPHGHAHIAVVDDANGYRDTARYFVVADKAGKPERQKGERRWSSSKNLDKPIVTVREISAREAAKPPKAPSGWTLLPDWRIWADDLGHIHQRYTCVRTDGGRGRVLKAKKRKKRKGKKARR